VIDDNSKDHTLAKAEASNQQHGNRANLIALSENGGPAAARNAGIKHAQEEWVAFLDADDAWLPWKLEAQCKALQQNPSAIFVCGKTVDMNTAIAEKEFFPPDAPSSHEITLDQLLSHNPIATSTVLAKRETLENCGAFDTRFKGPEDYDLWLRVVASGTCLCMDAILSKYRTTVGSLSMDDRSFLPEVLRVLEKAFSPDGALADYQRYYRLAKAEQFTAASWMAYNRGDKRRAISLLLRSWLQTLAPIEKEKADPLQRLKLFCRYLR
jgi:glycosyltransferase involved in cell wall biosynthesis